MTKDYANRLNAVRRRQPQRQSHAGLWIFTLVLFVAFTLGLAVLGKYRQYRRVEPKNHASATELTASELSLPAAKARSATTEDEIEAIALNQENKHVQEGAKNSQRGASRVGHHLQFEFTTPEALEKATAQRITVEKPQQAFTQKNDQALGGQLEDASEQALAAKMQEVERQQAQLTPSGQVQENGQYMLDVIKTKNYATADKLHARLALAGYEASIVTLTKQHASYYTITLGPYATKDDAVAQQKLLAGNHVKTTLRKM